MYLKEAKVSWIEPNNIYKKYKESAYISLVAYPVSHIGLDISVIIKEEGCKLQLHPSVWECSNSGVHRKSFWL
jgi:hypothetical protein